MKLNVLLAKTDLLASSFRAMVSDFTNFFKANQGDFRGEMKTYVAVEGMIDVPSERSDKRIVTTVDEKIQWFEEQAVNYIDALFSQEATNASGNAKAELKVNGVSWGEYSSLELLRLKSVVENGELEKMYSNIPVRSDSEQWSKTDAEFYSGREGIMQNVKQIGIKHTTTKESYILPDPNVKPDSPAYKPSIAEKTSVLKVGDYSYQRFTGEWSHRQRAELLKRRQALLVGITEALKEANEVEVVQSELTSKKLFDYLHKG